MTSMTNPVHGWMVAVLALWVGQMLVLLRYRWCGTRTMGKVVKIEEDSGYDNDGPVFRPLVEYRVDEKPFRITSVIFMYPSLYRLGEAVPVYYFAKNPWDARVITLREYLKWTVVMLGFMVFLGAILAYNSQA